MGSAGVAGSPNTAIDGVQLSTGDTPTQKPIGDGSMLISLLAGGDGTAFLDGEQPANQTLITKANTANARMMLSYQMKPLTNTYGIGSGAMLKENILIRSFGKMLIKESNFLPFQMSTTVLQ